MKEFKEQKWLFSFRKIRQRVFKEAKVDMEHVSTKEAIKHFVRMELYQKKISQKA